MAKKGIITAKIYVEGGISRRALAAIRREFIERTKSTGKVSPAELISLEYNKIVRLRTSYNFRQICDYYKDQLGLTTAPNSRTFATAFSKFEKAIKIEEAKKKRKSEINDLLS